MVVDEQDIPIGSASYDLVHSRGLLHRFVAIFVLDEKGRILIQKRSLKKPHANKLSESVSAHVLFGEQYLQTAKRKLKEEIGLESELNEICKIFMKIEEKEWKNNAFVNIYECKTKRQLTINHLEVENAYYFNLDIILFYLKKSPFLFVPGFKSVLLAYIKNRDT